MGTFSIWHLLLVLVAALLLFGRGKISEIMGDTAKGIKAFKKGMSDDDAQAKADPKPVDPPGKIVDAQATKAGETVGSQHKTG